MENFLSIEQTTETVVLVKKKTLLKVGICKEHIMSLFPIQIKTQEINLENKDGALHLYV